MFLIDCKEIYDSWLRDTYMSNMQLCRGRREWIRCVWDCWRFDKKLDKIFTNANQWLKGLVLMYPQLVDWELVVKR